MSPEQLEKEAERMVQDMMDGIAGSHYQYFLDILRAVHDAAREEGIQWAMNSERVLSAVKEIAKREGFNEALEKAARTADRFNDTEEGRLIAARIRARAKETK